MNGFKFTDLKCLAMMVLIIMAFCGDAGQYLLMAAALVWMFAKVLELHRSRRKEPPAQKGKAAAKPAAAPAVQPVQASRPAAPVQQPKPAVPRPQPIDPEMERVMLRHINFRITEKLQGAFPSAVWRWETAQPLEQAVKGGSARIRLSGVPNWNFTDVLFERSGRIRLEMLSLRPLEEMQKPAKEGPAADGDPDSVNLQNWYVIPREVEQVCRHIAQTTGSQNPMRNIMFRGPAGTGKTEGAKAIAAGLGIPYTFLTCSANTEVFDLLGQVLPKMEADAGLCSGLPSLMDIQMDPASAYCQMTGEYREDVTENEVLQKMVELKAQELGDGLNGNSFRYVDTPLVKAMRYGYLVELQEPTVIANPGVLVGLNSLLDRCASITLPNGERIQRHPETVVVVTTNTSYEGCKDLNQSVISRMNLTIDFDEPDVDTTVKRVAGITGCSDQKLVRQMAEVVRDIQQRCRETMIQDGSCGVRELISWVQSAMILGNPFESALYTVISSASADSENREELINTCLEPIFAKR